MVIFLDNEFSIHGEMGAVSAFWLGKLSNWHFTQETTDDIVQVTKVIHSIEQMVGSLDPKKKFYVRLASDRKATSQWSLNKIVLPADYLWKQASFSSFAHIVDLWTAFALHEAGHIILSKQLETAMIEETHQFIITHLVEDFWIEKWIGERYPGYSPYFQQFKQFYSTQEVNLGDDIISKKINDLIYFLNAENYQPLFRDSRLAAKLLTENWVKAKETGAVEGWDRIALGETIYQLLFPKGLTSVIKQEETKELNLANPNELEPTASSNQMKDVDLEIPSPFLLSGIVKKQQTIQFHHQVKEGQKLTWASEQMMETWLKDEERFLQQAAKSDDSTIIKKPKVTHKGIENYQSSYQRVTPYILKLRKKFETASTPRLYETLHLQQGMLDEGALYRAPYAPNLFKTVEERNDAIDHWNITVLIDQSRSTERLYSQTGRLSQLKRYQVATDLAVLFTNAFYKIKPINLKVYAYSTAMHSSALQLDELFSSKSTNLHRLGMISPKDATPEFLAIKEMTLAMNETSRGEVRKLIIVLSDGEPDDYKYGGGKEHREEIKDWLKKWTRRGYTFIHIALAEEIGGTDIYPISIQFEQDYDQLITKVYRQISSTLIK